MKDNKKMFIPILILFAALSVYTFGYLKIVFGYSFDTAISQNCSTCHNLRKSRIEPGFLAIRKDEVPEIGSTQSREPHLWTCAICHRNKRYDFNNDTVGAVKVYPSAHPVGVKGKSRSDLLAANKQPMYCTNCHDAAQTDRGVHSTYVTIFRLRSGGYGYGDPDPADDTEAIGSDSSSWFWKRPFDTSEIIDTTHRAYMKFGKVGLNLHYQSGGVSFNPANARAGKEMTDFYSAISDSSYQDISQLGTIYFCVNCHDGNGFPADPMDTTTSVTDSSEARIRFSNTKNFINGLYSYDVSDGNDNIYTPSDGGHVVQDSVGTRTGLQPGDRLPCIDCHDSHSSRLNSQLLRDDMTMTLGGLSDSGFVSRLYCQRTCHNTDANNAYYSNGVITKYGATETTSMMPDEDTARLTGGEAFSDYHDINSALSCYSYLSESGSGSTEAFGLSSGCHKSPHMPTMFCNGCHIDHFQAYGEVTRISHPVGVTLASFPLMAGDLMTIREYYDSFADTVEVALYNNGRIECLTCHNDHPSRNDTNYAPQTQGLLRGDAGTDITANLDSVKAGVGNNYKNHNSNFNERLRTLCTTGGTMSNAVFESLKSMPELCISCHFRIVGVDNNHGGFQGAGFGMCDKCHSMHGQHSMPVEGGELDSTNLIRPLHYGMYFKYNSLPTDNDYNTGHLNGGYETGLYGWDSVGDTTFTTIKVYQDPTGKMFSYLQNNHLIHEPGQERLCERCHGNLSWMNLVETSATQPPPPQVFYDTSGTMGDTADTYYTSTDTRPSNRNKSTHPVDIPGILIPGNAVSGTKIDLRCSSGTRSSGCHSAHGNNNYSQLNVMVKVNADSSSSIYGEADVLYKGEGTQAEYVSGMHEFCSLCHDRFAGDIRDANSTYTRHPIGPGVSMLNLYPDSTERTQVDSSFFSILIFDYDTNTYPDGKPNYDSFLTASSTYAATNYIVTCTTCHRQHGSGYLHLRKFNDRAVSECVNCHSKSPDILR